ncbi:PREDICTED: receptor-like protein 12 [Tarenaya hassleriana]|uniref:receptor-like protein 12 n=1 Tax=Tarenaya hassleriana TaxID=28532 RepID=UPI0008FD8366|nr:PREDICTED: receptor-like protein 12 [Tarenaya hassleriana]
MRHVLWQLQKHVSVSFLPVFLFGFLQKFRFPLSIVSTANVSSTSGFASELVRLLLSGCNITEFPEFVSSQRDMLNLDLSNNKIRGEIPDWLWRLPQLNVLNLSHNAFSSFHGSLEGFPATILVSVDISSNMFQGPLFVPSRYLRYLSAKGNHFSGEIPESICASSFMRILDLSNNSFTGSIPWCLRNLQSDLAVMNLGHNHLSGSFPDMFANGNSLESLDVSHNRLGGKLPKSLINCTRLEILNVGSNRIRDSFPLWLKSLQELQVLVLRSNEFHGTICGLTELPFGFPKLRVIDISHNQFLGALPSGFFANLKAMVRVGPAENGSESMYMQAGLGYYHDSIVLTNKGVQLEYTRILTVLTAIDFSGNRLHGEIPQSIGLLKDLRRSAYRTTISRATFRHV